METRVETLKCKSCGASMEVQDSALLLRCHQCGHLTEEQQPQALVSRSEKDTPIRDFVLRTYSRVLIVLMVYVLSTGPMYWAIYEAFNTNSSPFLAKLYFPIVLLCQSSDTICAWFDWYVGLWVY